MSQSASTSNSSTGTYQTQRLPLIWDMIGTTLRKSNIALSLGVSMRDKTSKSVICEHLGFRVEEDEIIINIAFARIWDQVTQSWSSPDQAILRFQLKAAEVLHYKSDDDEGLYWALNDDKGEVSIEFVQAMALYRPRIMSAEIAYRGDRLVDYTKPPLDEEEDDDDE